MTVNGKAWSCFERGGDAWRDVGHLVVDYRALLAWSAWADAAFGRHQLEIDNLAAQRAVYAASLDDAIANTEAARSAFASERVLRLQAERLALERPPRWAALTLGGVSVAEAVAVIALSIALGVH